MELRIEPFEMRYPEDYEVIDKGVEEMATDSGKELKLGGYVLKAK